MRVAGRRDGRLVQAVVIGPPPSALAMRMLVLELEPLALVTRPKVYGIEHVPDSGSLLVGNHTIYGLLDVPFMIAELWKRRQITVRFLGAHGHYAFPVWASLLERYGMVRGTRANTHELMRRGETIVVFPGGAREVYKRRGEKYKLIWEQRIGFARLAIEHGYPIVPFAAVGAEEMLDVVIDEDNPVFARLSQAVQKLTGWPLQPIVRGLGPTPFPRPQHLYFWFGAPIETAHLAARPEERAARAVRGEVERAVEEGIAFLLEERALDGDR